MHSWTTRTSRRVALPRSGRTPHSRRSSPRTAQALTTATLRSLTADGGEAQRRRRRGSRGGQRRRKGTGPGVSGGSDDDRDDGDDDLTDDVDGRTDNDEVDAGDRAIAGAKRDVSRNDETEAPASVHPDELPEPMREGRVMSVEAADKALVRKPQIGDTRPAPPTPDRRDAGAAAPGTGTVEPDRIAPSEAPDQRGRRPARASPT